MIDRVHVPGLGFASLLALSFLPLAEPALSQALPAEGDRQGRPDSMASLVRAMEEAGKKLSSVRLVVKMRTVIDMRSVMPGGQKLTTEAIAKLSSLRISKGNERQEYSRMESRVRGPAGVATLAVVRNQGGVWLHQANELRGERWLKVAPELAKKLDRAGRLFGGSALEAAGGQNVEGAIGAALLRGLASSYELRLLDDVKLDKTPCYHVVGKLKKSAGESRPGLRGRPSEVELFVGKTSLLVQKMLHKNGTETLYDFEVQKLERNPKLSPADFRLEPPAGVRFTDILSDPMMSDSIRRALQRLKEADEKAAADEGRKDAAGPAKKGTGK